LIDAGKQFTIIAMETTLTSTPQIIVEPRVILRDISWETYERLMKDHEDRSAPRFTYENGTLEIYMPTPKHEKITRFFEILISAIAEERELDIESFGSTTYKREDLKQGVEPDCCFYIQNAELIAGTDKLDLDIHPPPDLVVEVDITSPSVERFPIYAALGVPEIWQYAGGQVKIYILQNKNYAEAEESRALPKVTGEVLIGFLAESQTEKRSVWLKNLRHWTRPAAL